VDCSSNWDLQHFKSQAEQIFASFGVNATFLFQSDLNVSSISFSYSNVSELAFYSHLTKNYTNSIHLLVFDNFTANYVNNYWGYAPRSSTWYDGFKQINALNASYTSGIVAAGTILSEIGNEELILKVLLHELGHLLWCSHDSEGIMQQGPTHHLYFSAYSISQMRFDSIWSRDIGFDYYN